MSYEISWYIPKRVLFVRLTAEPTLDELESLAVDSRNMIQQGQAPVHILFDDAAGGNPPKSLKEIKSRMELAKDEGIGWLVAIGEAKPVPKFLLPLLMKVLKIDFVRHDTLEEGMEFLIQRDPTLES